MNLKNQLEEQLKKALREKDGVRKNALRMALASIKNAEVDNRKELEETVVISILQKEIKMRDETIAEARKAGRDEMVASIEAEIQILKEFLPKEFTEAELEVFLKRIIDETGAKSIKEMGLVMKNAIQQAGGRASNERISKFVREYFNQSD